MPRKNLIALALGFAAMTASALVGAQPAAPTVAQKASTASVESPDRWGLGQFTPKEPPKLSRLGLADPLVQQKYLNEPDLLRFLRGTYSEACTRGHLANTLNLIKLDEKNELSAEERNASAALLSSKRIWKLTSFEMEGIFGKAYFITSNHCDCLMQEITDADLVNPKKGLEVVKNLSNSVQKTCERIAIEKAEKQHELFKKTYGKEGLQ